MKFELQHARRYIACMRCSRRIAASAWTCLAPICGLLFASGIDAREPSGPRDDVTLQESGDVVTLANGLLTATISKSKARIEALQYRRWEMLRDGYFSMDGGRNYRAPSGCRFTIKTNTPDLIDIGMRQTWKDAPQAFDIEVHYVLERGASGLYAYAMLDHPANYPDTRVGEWRMVWKLSNDLLERIYVDNLRQWEMPGSMDRTEPTPIKEITKVLTGPRAGRFDCKYDFNSNYWDLGCWGHASDKNKVGAWIVLGSHEFFNDGPTKQDLTAASGINHIHFGMDHYNGSTIHVAVGQAWRKMFGPFLLYCNHADSAAACWADARRRASAEQQAWPYDWLTGNPDYPLEAERSAAQGRFVVRDPLKPAVTGAGAWVGLAAPRPGGNWQFESLNYQFWVKADERGRFAIPHVRPGIYTLYGFVDGAVGEFARTGVKIAVGKPTALGDVEWNVPHKGANRLGNRRPGSHGEGIPSRRRLFPRLPVGPFRRRVFQSARVHDWHERLAPRLELRPSTLSRRRCAGSASVAHSFRPGGNSARGSDINAGHRIGRARPNSRVRQR